MNAKQRFLLAVALVWGAGCSAENSTGPGSNPTGASVTYVLNGRLYRISASGGSPQDLSSALNALSAGADEGVNASPDGAWLVLSSERFGCAGYACYAVIAGNLSSGEAVRSGGDYLHGGRAAVASGGGVIVYPSSGGTHALDLFAVTKSGTAWSAPLLLTSASTYAYNDLPAISADGAKVLFDCGPQPYGAAGTAICEVGVNGTGFRTVIAPADGPGGSAANALHSADYGPAGAIVFEADWTGERVWRLPSGSTTPAVVGNYGNDNSPCVLSDGRIVSLWLGRPGNPAGLHELKVMPSDGSSETMLVTGQDIADVGLGCGG